MDITQEMLTAKKCYEAYDEGREKVIRLARSIVRMSKKAITAVHDNRFDDATAFLQELETLVAALQQETSFSQTGSYSLALQEYVEAKLFYSYAKDAAFLGFDAFSCSPEEYLLGVCDFLGELQRRAVVLVSKGDRDSIKQITQDAKQVYDCLLDLSFRGDLRKKFDSVKYFIIRLEEILMKLSLP